MKNFRIVTKMLPISHSLCPALLLPHHPPGPRPADSSQADLFYSCFLMPFSCPCKACSPLPYIHHLPCPLNFHSTLPCHHIEGSLLLQGSLCQPQKVGSVLRSISHSLEVDSHLWDLMFASLLHSIRGISTPDSSPPYLGVLNIVSAIWKASSIF